MSRVSYLPRRRRLVALTTLAEVDEGAERMADRRDAEHQAWVDGQDGWCPGCGNRRRSEDWCYFCDGGEAA